MSDTPTDADIATVLEAADHYVRVDDHQAAYDLLEPLHEGGSLSGETLGRASFLLGEACLGLDGLDAAMYYFEEATREATGDIQQRARARIDEIGRRDDAVDAEYEGVEGEQEAESVLDAGDDALTRGDDETAWRFYSQAYDGIQMTNPQVSRAAVGMAACHLNAGDTQEAEGYLQVAEGADASALASRIEEIRAEIKRLEAGDEAAEGGVERTELDELNEAGMAASRSGDWETAYRYFEQLHRSDLLSGTERGRVAGNLGITCLYTHDYDAAHQYLTEASQTARPDIAARATKILGDLEQMDDAADVVAGIDPDESVVESDD